MILNLFAKYCKGLQLLIFHKIGIDDAINMLFLRESIFSRDFRHMSSFGHSAHSLWSKFEMDCNWGFQTTRSAARPDILGRLGCSAVPISTKRSPPSLALEGVTGATGDILKRWPGGRRRERVNSFDTVDLTSNWISERLEQVKENIICNSIP